MRARSGRSDPLSWALSAALACSGSGDERSEPAAGGEAGQGGRPSVLDRERDPRCTLEEQLIDGKCEPRGEAGAPCREHADCRAELSCRYEPAACANEECSELDGSGTCGVPAARGEPCVPDREQCESGLVCHVDRSCGLPGVYGAPCAGDNECEGSLVCRSFVLGGACGPTSGVGDECNAYGDCTEGLVCYSDGRCDEPHQALAGQRCRADDECASALVCRVNPEIAQGLPVCEPASPLGGDCVRDAECEEGSLCIGQECRLLGELGGACEEDADCTDELVCNLADPAFPSDAVGACRPLAAAGLPCWFADDCEVGLECRYAKDASGADGGLCAAPAEKPGD